MKSTMPYYGVNLPTVRAIAREVFAGRAMGCNEWRATILDLWRGARHREERYVAQYLLESKQHASCLTPDDMPMLEELVVSGAWWDLVDELATVVGELLRRYPKQMRPLMRRWSRDPNLWKRRVSIICQLRFKRDTDLDLLYSNIEPNLADKDFFIRKAIGWALREYAYTAPEAVRAFLDRVELSPLSVREASKHL